jgi:hypothetical protein
MRVHDLRHAFGERAADGGIPLEVRRSLLGHEHRDFTLHNSSPGLARLLEEVERIVRPVPEVVTHHTWTVPQDGAAEHAKGTMKPARSVLAF